MLVDRFIQESRVALRGSMIVLKFMVYNLNIGAKLKISLIITTDNVLAMANYLIIESVCVLYEVTLDLFPLFVFHCYVFVLLILSP